MDPTRAWWSWIAFAPTTGSSFPARSLDGPTFSFTVGATRTATRESWILPPSIQVILTPRVARRTRAVQSTHQDRSSSAKLEHERRDLYWAPAVRFASTVVVDGPANVAVVRRHEASTEMTKSPLTPSHGSNCSDVGLRDDACKCSSKSPLG